MDVQPNLLFIVHEGAPFVGNVPNDPQPTPKVRPYKAVSSTAKELNGRPAHSGNVWARKTMPGGILNYASQGDASKLSKTKQVLIHRSVESEAVLPHASMEHCVGIVGPFRHPGLLARGRQGRATHRRSQLRTPH